MIFVHQNSFACLCYAQINWAVIKVSQGCARLQLLSTMLTMQQKAQCLIWYMESKPIVSAQPLFQRTYPGQTASNNKAIIWWFNQFRETGSMQKRSRPGWLRTSEENVEHICQSCIRNPKKYIARRNLELHISKTTIQNILHKWLRLHPYKIQIKNNR